MVSPLSDDMMIAVSSMPDFLASLPSCFQVCPDGGLRHDPNRVNVFLHSSRYKSTFRSTYGGIIKVRNDQELEQWRQNVLSKPMFLDVFCSRKLALGVVTIVYKIHFAVLVNTRHPHIRQQIERGFNEAKRLMAEGKQFSVEFDFTTPVREWYSVAAQQSDGACTGSIFGKYGRVCLTNASKYASCFRCNRETAGWWILCLPCCLLSCPFYAIHRGVTCEDVNVPIGAEVTLMVPEHLVEPYLQTASIAQVHEYTERPAPIMIQPAQPPTYEEIMREQQQQQLQTNDTHHLLPADTGDSNRV